MNTTIPQGIFGNHIDYAHWYVTWWALRMMDVIENYDPDFIFTDGGFTQPFSGIKNGTGSPPPGDQRICAGVTEFLFRGFGLYGGRYGDLPERPNLRRRLRGGGGQRVRDRMERFLGQRPGHQRCMQYLPRGGLPRAEYSVPLRSLRPNTGRVSPTSLHLQRLSIVRRQHQPQPTPSISGSSFAG